LRSFFAAMRASVAKGRGCASVTNSYLSDFR
jgi:hypothetical protein